MLNTWKFFGWNLGNLTCQLFISHDYHQFNMLCFFQVSIKEQYCWNTTFCSSFCRFHSRFIWFQGISWFLFVNFHLVFYRFIMIISDCQLLTILWFLNFLLDNMYTGIAILFLFSYNLWKNFFVRCVQLMKVLM